MVKIILLRRKDDNLETIMSRYDIYTKTTEPVLNFLSKNPNFKEIDGTLEIDEITVKLTLLSMFKALTLDNLII